MPQMIFHFIIVVFFSNFPMNLIWSEADTLWLSYNAGLWTYIYFYYFVSWYPSTSHSWKWENLIKHPTTASGGTWRDSHRSRGIKHSQLWLTRIIDATKNIRATKSHAKLARSGQDLYQKTLSPDRHDTLGPDSIRICHLTSIGNPIVEIRRSYDRLISTMGFPIPVIWHLYIESGLLRLVLQTKKHKNCHFVDCKMPTSCDRMGELRYKQHIQNYS